MERGVVVGGLMICGSFLLAASLNRSAVEETSPSEPAIAEAPIAPPLPAVHVGESKSAACADGASGASATAAVAEPEQGDLPGNVLNACSQ